MREPSINDLMHTLPLIDDSELLNTTPLIPSPGQYVSMDPPSIIDESFSPVSTADFGSASQRLLLRQYSHTRNRVGITQWGDNLPKAFQE